MSTAGPVLDDPAPLAPATAAAVVLHAGRDEALGCASLLMHEATAQVTSEEVFSQATDPRQYDGDGMETLTLVKRERASITIYITSNPSL
jgi:hypothetical protein